MVKYDVKMKIIDIFPKPPIRISRLYSMYERYISEYQQEFDIIEHQYLEEGIHKSYPRELVIKYLINQFKNTISIYPPNIDPNNILIGVQSSITDINNLIQFITKMGWFISDIETANEEQPNIQQQLQYLNTNPNQRAIITIETKQGDQIDIPNFLYHVTPLPVWNSKIKQIGLAPKSIKSYHPERIYLLTTKNMAMKVIPVLAKERLQSYKNTSYDSDTFNPKQYFKKWVVLEIDTNKIDKLKGLNYFKLYKDPNVDENGPHMALFTLYNIPPDAINAVGTVQAY